MELTRVDNNDLLSRCSLLFKENKVMRRRNNKLV